MYKSVGFHFTTAFFFPLFHLLFSQITFLLSFHNAQTEMSLSENDQDDVFVTHFQQQTKLNRSQQQQQQSYKHSASTAPIEKSDQLSEFSPTVSWPILLAVIPTLGAFFAGSADIWSDFIMLLLILYYVYKWMTGKKVYSLIYRTSLFMQKL